MAMQANPTRKRAREDWVHRRYVCDQTVRDVAAKQRTLDAEDLRPGLELLYQVVKAWTVVGQGPSSLVAQYACHDAAQCIPPAFPELAVTRWLENHSCFRAFLLDVGQGFLLQTEQDWDAREPLAPLYQLYANFRKLQLPREAYTVALEIMGAPAPRVAAKDQIVFHFSDVNHTDAYLEAASRPSVWHAFVAAHAEITRQFLQKVAAERYPKHGAHPLAKLGLWVYANRPQWMA